MTERGSEGSEGGVASSIEKGERPRGRTLHVLGRSTKKSGRREHYLPLSKGRPRIRAKKRPQGDSLGRVVEASDSIASERGQKQ
jgi:hypothetical protein